MPGVKDGELVIVLASWDGVIMELGVGPLITDGFPWPTTVKVLVGEVTFCAPLNAVG